MKNSVKTAGAVLGASALAAAGVMGVLPAMADVAPATLEVQAGQVADVAVEAVEGEFAYTQDALTGMGVFAKAAAAVCASLPDYAATCTCMTIAIASGDAELVATVQEMMADGQVETHIMGCACSSNAPAGGAVANAEVSGVSLESVAELVGAL